MATDQTYKLAGYIEYDQSTVGFVTPVFKNQLDQYCIQITTPHQPSADWEVLPLQFRKSVVSPVAISEIKKFDLPIYGFKWDNKLFFAPANEMAGYLTGSIKLMEEEGVAIAKAFLDDLKLLEPNSNDLSKEEVWRKCKAYLSVHGAFDQTFLEYIEVVDFMNGTLTIEIKSRAIRNMFETRGFKEALEDLLGKELPNFKIEFTRDDEELVLPILFSATALSSKYQHIASSCIIKTSINSYQSFDNFIVSDFNKSAFSKALTFTKNEAGKFILICGHHGLGKTHLVNSIAKSFIENDNAKNIGFFSVLPQSDKDFAGTWDLSGFEDIASPHDVIIIDDVHRINNVDSAMKLILTLGKWSKEGKKIVLSIDGSAYESTLKQGLWEADHIFLQEPKVEDKVNVIKKKTHELNLPLTGGDILTLSENDAIKNISDIHRSLTKILFKEELRTGLLPTYYNFNKLDNDWIETSVCEYLRIDSKHYFEYSTDPIVQTAKVLSRFIEDLIDRPKERETLSGSDIISVGSHLYSRNAIDHYLFTSDHFRKAVLEILTELLSKGGK